LALNWTRRRADEGGVDPVKQKLWSDLREVLAEVALALHFGRAPRTEAFCASADEQSDNDAGLCYFHLN
jgi:hypothetical protein